MDELRDDWHDGPLRLVRSPLRLDFYEPTELGVLILSDVRWHYEELAEVSVDESPERIVVTLFRRLLIGTYPDGAGAAENTAGKSGAG